MGRAEILFPLAVASVIAVVIAIAGIGDTEVEPDLFSEDAETIAVLRSVSEAMKRLNRQLVAIQATPQPEEGCCNDHP